MGVSGELGIYNLVYHRYLMIDFSCYHWIWGDKVDLFLKVNIVKRFLFNPLLHPFLGLDTLCSSSCFAVTFLPLWEVDQPLGWAPAILGFTSCPTVRHPPRAGVPEVAPASNTSSAFHHPVCTLQPLVCFISSFWIQEKEKRAWVLLSHRKCSF